MSSILPVYFKRQKNFNRKWIQWRISSPHRKFNEACYLKFKIHVLNFVWKFWSLYGRPPNIDESLVLETLLSKDRPGDTWQSTLSIRDSLSAIHSTIAFELIFPPLLLINLKWFKPFQNFNGKLDKVSNCR